MHSHRTRIRTPTTHLSAIAMKIVTVIIHATLLNRQSNCHKSLRYMETEALEASIRPKFMLWSRYESWRGHRRA